MSGKGNGLIIPKTNLYRINNEETKSLLIDVRKGREVDRTIFQVRCEFLLGFLKGQVGPFLDAKLLSYEEGIIDVTTNSIPFIQVVVSDITEEFLMGAVVPGLIRLMENKYVKLGGVQTIKEDDREDPDFIKARIEFIIDAAIPVGIAENDEEVQVYYGKSREEIEASFREKEREGDWYFYERPGAYFASYPNDTSGPGSGGKTR